MNNLPEPKSAKKPDQNIKQLTASEPKKRSEKRIYRAGRRLKWFHNPSSKDGDCTSGNPASLRRRRTSLYTSNLWLCCCCCCSFCQVCTGDESAAAQLPQLSVASSIAIQQSKPPNDGRKTDEHKILKRNLLPTTWFQAIDGRRSRSAKIHVRRSDSNRERIGFKQK